MPGHNHYADCTCGWCTGGGGGRRQIWVRNDEVDRAKRVLSQYYVSAGRQAASFVNPNAHCPVCGARVYYYQNVYGSRVFFDDLGGDWPKHPCTNNKPVSIRSAPGRVVPQDFVSFRSRREIVEAALTVGTPLRGTVPDTTTNVWVLALISEVWVFPTRKLVLADRISFDGTLSVVFSCDDPDDLVDVDEIVSLGPDTLSLLDPNTLLKSTIAIQTWHTTEDFRSFKIFHDTDN
jgi:hypothetical protein